MQFVFFHYKAMNLYWVSWEKSNLISTGIQTHKLQFMSMTLNKLRLVPLVSKTNETNNMSTTVLAFNRPKDSNFDLISMWIFHRLFNWLHSSHNTQPSKQIIMSKSIHHYCHVTSLNFPSWFFKIFCDSLNDFIDIWKIS